MSRNRLGMKSHARRNDLVRSRLEAASRHWARMTRDSEIEASRPELDEYFIKDTESKPGQLGARRHRHLHWGYRLRFDHWFFSEPESLQF
jgi:hypothetical protein